jgi:hypothetical protein
MSALGELLRENPPNVSSQRSSLRADRASAPDASYSLSTRDEQIYALVQQLFYRHVSGPVRSVGFTRVEAGTETARLCFDVAKALAEESTHDVGLIDAGLGQLPLAGQLQIPSPASAAAPWAVSQRLWLVPRESWCQEGGQQPTTPRNLERLREYVSEFDFSVVHCRPISWLTARIGQSCDGLVLVLTANKTRRLVAAQVKDQLNRAHVPLLGTVLADRRFPVPSSLYRSL